MRVLPFVLAGLAAGRGIASSFGFGDEAQIVLTSPTAEESWYGSDLAALAAAIQEDAQSPASCAACEVRARRLRYGRQILTWKTKDNYILSQTCRLERR